MQLVLDPWGQPQPSTMTGDFKQQKCIGSQAGGQKLKVEVSVGLVPTRSSGENLRV